MRSQRKMSSSVELQGLFRVVSKTLSETGRRRCLLFQPDPLCCVSFRSRLVTGGFNGESGLRERRKAVISLFSFRLVYTAQLDRS